MRKLWKEAVRLLTCVVAMSTARPRWGTREFGLSDQETKKVIIAPNGEAELHKENTIYPVLQDEEEDEGLRRP